MHIVLRYLLFYVPLFMQLVTNFSATAYYVFQYQAKRSESEAGLFGLDVSGTLNFLMLQVLYVMSLWSILAAHCADPGLVPYESALDVDPKASGAALGELYEKHCEKCEAWKPPRAYHCKVCRRCVIQMDHHCTLINNCVGAKNQKLFILMLVYNSLLAIFGVGFLLLALYHYVDEHRFYFQQVEQLLLHLNFDMVLALATIFFDIYFILVLNRFFSSQQWSLASNQTMVEFQKFLRGAPIEKKQRLELIFGPRRLRWWIPRAEPSRLSYLERTYLEKDVKADQADCTFDKNLRDASARQSKLFRKFLIN